MTRRQLLDNLDSAELSEWHAFDRLEPIDAAYRGEVAAGIVARTMYNLHRDPNADAAPIDDFMIDWSARETTPEETDAQKQQAAELLAARMDAAAARIGIVWEGAAA